MPEISDIAILRKARECFNARNHIDATDLSLRVLAHDSKNAEALKILAEIALREERHDDAVECLQRFIKSHPKDSFGYAALGSFYNKLGKHREAILQYEKLLRLHPNHPTGIHGLAKTYENDGQYDKARQVLAASIQSGNEIPHVALVHAKLELEAKRTDEAIAILLKHINGPMPHAQVREEFWFVLGQAYERAGDYDKAFEAYRNAHSVRSREFDFDGFKRKIDEIIEVFSAQTMARLPRAANSSRLPILIAGRPRSGSTLVERIIGAHPQVHAAGELVDILKMTSDLGMHIGSTLSYPQCVRDLDQADVNSLSSAYLKTLKRRGGQAQRVTDKHLDIREHLGFIALICPHAAVIDLRRDAVDNCLACYTAHFTIRMAYNGDLRQLGLVHRQYERLMDHWHSVLDLPILRVNYEDIVADQEYWTRKMIEFCGLIWDEKCLRFYEKDASRSTSAAITLSYNQVRQPVYKTSVGRAAKFEKYLGPLYEALGQSRL